MALDLGTLVARLRVDNDMARGLADGRRDIDRFTRDANGRLRDMRGRFASASRAAGQSVGDGIDRGSRRGLGGFSNRLRAAGDVIGDLAKKGAKGVGDLASSFGRLAKENPQIALGAVVGILGALPVAAGVAASAITVGLGGALSMVAIRAASSAKSVQDAFKGLQDDLKGGLRDAAAPFEGSLVRMIATAREQLAGLAGPVRAAFAHLAPAVEAAFGSVARAVGSLGPTFSYIAQQAAPLIETLGRELGSLVKGLASDFGRLAAAADPRFITIFMGAIRGLSAALTEVIVRASEAGSWILDLVGMDRPAVSARNLGEAFLKTAAGARDASEAVQDATEAFAEHLDPSLAVFNATTRMQQAFQDLRKSLKDSATGFEGNSEAALRAKSGLGSMIQSIRETYLANRAAGDSHDKARSAIQRQIQALEKLAGDSKTARAQINALKRALDSLKDKTVRINTVYTTPSDRVDPLTRRGFSTGGLVGGPGTETSDSVPAMLSRGEYVLPAKTVRRVGVKKLDALRRGGNGGLIDAAIAPGLTDSFYGGPDGSGSYGSGSGRGSMKAEAAKARRKLMAQLEDQVKTLKAGLKRIREAREDLLEGLTSMSSDTVKSTARNLSDMVKQAFEGLRRTTTTDDRLLARISQTSKRLQVMANQRARIAEQLQEALNFAASVTSRAAGDASVLGIEVVDAEGNRLDPNAGELKTGLQARLATLRKFAGDIKTLAGQGLSKTVLRQLMEAGPEQAGALAAAIASGGQQAVNEITAVQNEIDAEAKNLGEFSADHLYDAGAKAGEGFLTGLQGQLDTLENTMETLATNLINAVTEGIAKAQKLAADKLEKVKELGEASGSGRGGKGSGPDEISKGPSASDSIRNPGKDNKLTSTNMKAAVNIERYYEGNKGGRQVAEELLLLTRARG